ncbi:B12-binding domain-containing radical SAM protein [bacterium]|nr:B12-binding domain-containing radical SAM protein [bacterium]
MRKVTFIMPCVGRRAGQSYPRSWLMEPLAIAQLAALTPASWQKVFYDDRLESIPYDEPTALVAISVETYTARRAYQIGEQFRKRGVPVVMGGFHPTLAPDDAASHADAIVIGEAEETWPRLLDDFAQGRLAPRYTARRRPNLAGIFPDRSIFAGKRYMDLALVETGRGCRHHCDFCSIAAFFSRTFSARPVGDVAREVERLGRKRVFFVDDNLAVDRARALDLFEAIEPLRIHWVGQIGVHAAGDDAFLRAMRRSGCLGVLVGFESLRAGSKAVAGKGLNGAPAETYAKAIAQFTRHKLAVYGTFVFGYDGDTRETIASTAAFARRQRLFFAAMNHLVPFPGTPLYERLHHENRLIQNDWWLAPDYRFGDLAFHPDGISAPEFADACFRARRWFYAWRQVLGRATNIRGNCNSLALALIYFSSNLLSGRDAARRQGMPLGIEEGL